MQYICVGGDTSEAVKCDRCGKMIDGSKGNDIAFFPNPCDYRTVCEDCLPEERDSMRPADEEDE